MIPTPRRSRASTPSSGSNNHASGWHLRCQPLVCFSGSYADCSGSRGLRVDGYFKMSTRTTTAKIAARMSHSHLSPPFLSPLFFRSGSGLLSARNPLVHGGGGGNGLTTNTFRRLHFLVCGANDPCGRFRSRWRSTSHHSLGRRLVLNPWQSRHVRMMLSLWNTSVELPA